MKFYGHFAAAYGTFWLAMLCVSILTQKPVHTGAFGLYGFPILAFFYALIRMASDTTTSEIFWLRDRVDTLERELVRRADRDE